MQLKVAKNKGRIKKPDALLIFYMYNIEQVF
jgi:hypothetical protein